jgi:prephenate dehydrogenase
LTILVISFLVIRPEKTEVSINNEEFKVDVADSDEEQQIGLSEKNKLDVIQVATAINNLEEVMKPAAPKVRRKGPVIKYEI